MAVQVDGILPIGKMIAAENRETAAAAYIKRGDIDKAQGSLKHALVDGYLRVVYLFRDVKAVQPEALYRAMECFTALEEHQRAEKMRKRLLVDFGNSPYTQRLNKK